MATLAAFAGGALSGGLLCGFGHGLVGLELLLAGGIVVLLTLVRLCRAPAVPATDGSVTVTHAPVAVEEAPGIHSILDRGLRDIRQTDPGFDPSRFAGYAAMTYRDTRSACMRRDVGSLRDRVTPEMYGQLQARCARSRDAPTNRVEDIEIRAEITEAWQESGRDYVTAFIGGSLDSPLGVRLVREFWTFTRPAGLNFWMLSVIQTATEESSG